MIKTLPIAATKKWAGVFGIEKKQFLAEHININSAQHCKQVSLGNFLLQFDLLHPLKKSKIKLCEIKFNQCFYKLK